MILQFINWPLAIASSLLISIGTLVIYSSSPNLGMQQIIFAVFGAVLFFVISLTDYKTLFSVLKPLYILNILLLVLVFILGFETRGTLRWIPLGPLNIQPSELAKPILILALAYFWSNHLSTWNNILKSAALILPLLVLIFRQPDLGTALTILGIWAGILFCAKVSIKKALVMVLILLILFPIAQFFLKDYQRERISSFLYPGKDPLGVGYNLIQSTIAVGSGQLLGRGLGYGTQSRLQFLPEYRTDFIFAAIAEEFGFLGSLLILSLYIFIIAYCLFIARTALDYPGFLIGSGVSSMLIFQVVVNIGMSIGLLPITGITLPLISYGGSSLIATFISLGLVASVARQRKRFDKALVAG